MNSIILFSWKTVKCATPKDPKSSNPTSHKKKLKIPQISSLPPKSSSVMTPNAKFKTTSMKFNAKNAKNCWSKVLMMIVIMDKQDNKKKNKKVKR